MVLAYVYAMFNIQYQAINGTHGMQHFDSKSRMMLVRHLTRFNRPIMAVYEGSNVITKVMRAELSKLPVSSLSRAAKDFVSSRQ